VALNQWCIGVRHLHLCLNNLRDRNFAFFCLFFETRFHIQHRLASDSWFCLHLPNSGITGMHQHTKTDDDDECCTGVWTHDFVLASVSIFQIGTRIYAWAHVDLDPSLYASLPAGMASTCHLSQLLLIDMKSHFLPKLLSSLDPSNLHFPSSWVIDRSHCAQLRNFYCTSLLGLLEILSQTSIYLPNIVTVR
jgi:hypothetical protein